MVTVKIENVYSDGHESTHEAIVQAPHRDDLTDLDSWFDHYVFEHLGDGHGIGTDLGSCYTATIIAADDPELLGKTCEWID